MSPTCAKCGAFGGYERKVCGFPIDNVKGGGICDGRVFTDKHELQRAKDALWWESCLAKSEAELTRLRAALAEIAALRPDDPIEKAYRTAGIARAALVSK